MTMEMEHPADEQAPKKGRHRKKLLYNSILQLMEFYFSDSNLAKDRFISQLIQDDPFMDLSIFLKFNKMRKLTTNIEDIAKAISKSELLELSEDKTRIKRKTPIKINQNVDECTIYVEKIKTDATHDWLSAIFSEFGNVTYVSVPKYRHNKLNKGFAFVEFEKENEAKQALEYFESIGCKMSSQMSPEDLCSIATYEGDGKNEKHGESQDEKLNSAEDTATTTNKRKRSDDSEGDSKKLKANGSTEITNSVEGNLESEDGEDRKKKKSKKTKKKINFKELGLQILSKNEWKKMRNRYLDMQKKKMQQLKQFLHKKRFNRRLEDYKQKTYFETDEAQQHSHEENDQTKEAGKLEFVPGVIVKVHLPEPCYEIKKVKNDLKSHSDQIKYIDLPVPTGSEEAYLRFSDAEAAKKFCSSEFNDGQCSLLEGDEEKSYWQKIESDRSSKFKKENKKKRGRDKLLKKAEKELGKHIRFDDAD